MELTEKYSPILWQLHEHPLTRTIIQTSTCVGIPFGLALDNFLTKKKKEKQIAFFDTLNDGSTVLTEDIINDDNFLHAFFATLNYVVRQRSNAKIEGFTKILKELATKKIEINRFEDYTAIFDELSEREFAILSIKYDFEQRFRKPNESAGNYWQEFKDEVLNKVDITEGELEPLLSRAQRTGCFQEEKLFWQDDGNLYGNTTEIFKVIRDIINQ